MSGNGIDVRNYAGLPVVFYRLEASDPPKVHYTLASIPNWMNATEWYALPAWDGALPRDAYK